MLCKYKIDNRVYSLYSLQSLKGRFSKTDLVVIDLDECLFPGFSQTILGVLIFVNICFFPYKINDWKYIPQLVKGGFFITFTKIKSWFNYNTGNRDLLDKYEMVMKGIPRVYFDSMVKYIPRLSYPFSAGAIRELAKKAPVGLVSFGLNIILEEYVKEFKKGGTPLISFYDSNIIYFKDSGFAGYQRSQLKTNKFDKKAVLERILSEFNARHPMVIGHNEDDLEMVKYAQENGGIGIGYNPKK